MSNVNANAHTRRMNKILAAHFMDPSEVVGGTALVSASASEEVKPKPEVENGGLGNGLGGPANVPGRSAAYANSDDDDSDDDDDDY